jgi:hypothetical protein
MQESVLACANNSLVIRLEGIRKPPLENKPEALTFEISCWVILDFLLQVYKDYAVGPAPIQN